MSPFRWGIVGTGFVARKFVLGLRAAESAAAAAVVSRSAAKAAEFAGSLAIPVACTSIAEAADKVDAFYIATPPSAHCEQALACINAGRPVLVEKPFTVDGGEARQIAEAARAASVFCMEAMWTRFLPLVRRLKRMVAEGDVGEVRLLAGSFGLAEAVDPRNNHFNAGLGGGALLDRGVYPISLASHLLGAPTAVLADAILGDSGVDEDLAVTLRFANGGLGLFQASLRTQCANDFSVMGTAARIDVAPPLFRPSRMTVTPVHAKTYRPGGPGKLDRLKESGLVHGLLQRFGGLAALRGGRARCLAESYSGNGYHYQADEVRRCVLAGRLESDIMPLADSIAVMETLDAVRRQWQAREQRSGESGRLGAQI